MKPRFTPTVRRCSPETCRCAGQLMGFRWGSTICTTAHTLFQGRCKLRTELNCTPSSMWRSVSLGDSSSSPTAWESLTKRI
eukprot:12382349-Heterocapsa_arctica.AAC.1